VKKQKKLIYGRILQWRKCSIYLRSPFFLNYLPRGFYTDGRKPIGNLSEILFKCEGPIMRHSVAHDKAFLVLKIKHLFLYCKFFQRFFIQFIPDPRFIWYLNNAIFHDNFRLDNIFLPVQRGSGGVTWQDKLW